MRCQQHTYTREERVCTRAAGTRAASAALCAAAHARGRTSTGDEVISRVRVASAACFAACFSVFFSLRVSFPSASTQQLGMPRAVDGPRGQLQHNDEALYRQSERHKLRLAAPHFRPPLRAASTPLPPRVGAGLGLRLRAAAGGPCGAPQWRLP
jgi:hypothetical protein